MGEERKMLKPCKDTPAYYIHNFRTPCMHAMYIPIIARRYYSIFAARERRSCLAWRYQIYHPVRQGYVDR